MHIGLYVLLCLIWGSTWLAIKVGLVGVPPFLGAGRDPQPRGRRDTRLDP